MGSRGFWIVLSLSVIATLSVFAVWPPYTAGMRQRDNIRRAVERLPALQTILDAEPRFSQIALDVLASRDGAIRISGFVENPEDLFRLMRAMAAVRLPVALDWEVHVLSEDAKR